MIETEGGRIFDTHAHYGDPAFDADREALLTRLPEEGVCGVIECGCDRASSESALALAHRFGFVYAAVGLHPENTAEGYDETWIRRLAADERCVAIGEIGLDYHWSPPNPTDREILERQLALAAELDKPVVIHDREAHGDAFDCVRAHRPRGVFHCYSGSREEARQLLDMGFYLGFGGALTFRNARKAVEVVAYMPLDRLLLETDAPYMAPEPLRGQRCHSGMILHVARRVAEIKGLSLREVLDATRRNAHTLFSLPTC